MIKDGFSIFKTFLSESIIKDISENIHEDLVANSCRILLIHTSFKSEGVNSCHWLADSNKSVCISYYSLQNGPLCLRSFSDTWISGLSSNLNPMYSLFVVRYLLFICLEITCFQTMCHHGLPTCWDTICYVLLDLTTSPVTTIILSRSWAHWHGWMHKFQF